MKVVALLSGGKDSCFNMMHCIANGHEIVALATLTPEEGIDEIDSYMYQSVGTSLLPLLAESMRLPLYRQVIKGKPVEVGGTYGSRNRSQPSRAGQGGVKGDETEDLEALLLQVKSHHPDITGLSSGAILSTYQRSRIEHITSRPHISLTPLSYLWQQPERPLVISMIRSGLVPVLVKVAGMGLEIKDVGKELSELEARLGKLERDWGCHFAGEGGEYETICVDGPMFHDRVIFEETETIITDPSPVAHLRVSKAKLVPKPHHVVPTMEEMKRLIGLDQPRQPPTARSERDNDEDIEEDVDDDQPLLHSNVLDGESQEMVRVLSARSALVEQDDQDLSMDELKVSVPQTTSPDVVRVNQQGRWFSAVVELHQEVGEATGDLMRRHFSMLEDKFQETRLGFPMIQHINLYLASMSDFPLVNAEYIKWFGSEPPSRACVGIHLDADAGQVLRLEAVGWDDQEEIVNRRTGLHVQGLSYWAPANIGPYSQGVVASNRLTIAGQIPLLPRTLTFSTPRNVLFDAILALQHVRRIIEVMGDSSKGGAGWINRGWIEGVVGWYVGGKDVERVVRAVWTEFARRHGCQKTPVIFVAARELPKGASCEWQVTRHTGDPSWPAVPRETVANADDSDEEDDDACAVRVRYDQGQSWRRCISHYGDASFTMFCFKNQEEFVAALSDHEIRMDLGRCFSARLFYDRTFNLEQTNKVVEMIDPTYGIRTSLIPVTRITNAAGIEAGIALVIAGSR